MVSKLYSGVVINFCFGERLPLPPLPPCPFHFRSPPSNHFNHFRFPGKVTAARWQVTLCDTMWHMWFPVAGRWLPLILYYNTLYSVVLPLPRFPSPSTTSVLLYPSLSVPYPFIPLHPTLPFPFPFRIPVSFFAPLPGKRESFPEKIEILDCCRWTLVHSSWRANMVSKCVFVF